MRYYAGIGSRDTPQETLEKMYTYAIDLAGSGYTLRSGGAKGADSMFENGCDMAQGHKQIFKATDCTVEANILSAKYHPNWGACNSYVRKLHGRNAMILLGRDLNTPVEFIICWTPSGAITGGTGQALRMAPDYDIRVINLAIEGMPEIQ